MSTYLETSISLDKMSGGPSDLVQGARGKKTIDDRKTAQSLVDAFKESESLCSTIETMVVDFPDAGGQPYCGIEIDFNVSARRPTFIKKVVLDDVNQESSSLYPTNHPNLLNLMDVWVSKGEGVYLAYERPGISLSKVQQLNTIDRIAVATICKKVIQGLIYIHNVLNLEHGNLNCDSIYLHEDGEVKIGDIGKSMIQARKTKDFSRDVEAVYDIAECLLNLDTSSDKRSLSWIMADNFLRMPSDISLKSLLEHPFFNISQDSRYLLHIGEVVSFIRNTLESQ